jgi:hypothetical protein
MSDSAYYNEYDKYAAQWLRNLIEAGHIAHGIVDERSIEDVTPGDLQGFTQCHFFAGIGVWSYALRRAGWPVEPGTFPLAHGAPARVGRLRAYGNGLCAPAAETFIASVMEAA